MADDSKLLKECPVCSRTDHLVIDNYFSIEDEPGFVYIRMGCVKCNTAWSLKGKLDLTLLDLMTEVELTGMIKSRRD